jgi:hypothetical protein
VKKKRSLCAQTRLEQDLRGLEEQCGNVTLETVLREAERRGYRDYAAHIRSQLRKQQKNPAP